MKPIIASAFQKASSFVGEDFAIEAKKHAKAHDANLRAHRNACEVGDKKKMRASQHRILKSYSSTLTCVVCSLKTKTSPDKIREIARSLNPFEDCGEVVRVTCEPKSSGEGFRIINAFGIKRRALHRLCTDILGVQFKPYPSDYLKKGAGADRASDHIVELIEDDQCSYFALFDIKDFYGSVQHEGVREMLGLPNAVTNNCILLSSRVPLYMTKEMVLTSPFDGAVRRGLPQGSRASGLVASILLGSVLEHIAPGHRVVIYGDDIALAARSKKEAEAMMKALKSALDSHPAGPFRLKRCEIKHINDGFDFTKYRTRKKPDYFGGDVVRSPANMSFIRFKKNTTKKIQEKKSNGEGWVLPAFQYRTCWIRAFGHWDVRAQSLALLNCTFQEGIIEALAVKDKNRKHTGN